MLYKVKLIQDATDTKNKKTVKAREAMLKDLLMVMPTLKKHKLEGEIHTKIRKLRDGRKSKSYTLELARTFQGKELKASAALTRMGDKMRIMRDLKAEIRAQIQEERRVNRPPIEDFTFRQGVTVKKLAEVYLEPGSFFEVFKRKIRLDMTRGKKPSTKDNYIGIEIELASKHDRDFICDKLFEAGLGRYVTVKDDGSIGSGTKLRETHRYPHEICVLAKQSEYKDVVERLCNVLNTQCDVKVDKTCGLHVHVDMRNRVVERAFNNLVKTQQFLYAMLPAARRSSRYSYPVKGANWRVLDERYHGINSQAYQKYGTLEARMHCGTTQSAKINNWIELLLAIVESPEMSRPPVSIEGLQQATGIRPELVEYVKSRITKFADQHKSTPPTAEEPGTMPNLEEIAGPIQPDASLTEESEVA